MTVFLYPVFRKDSEELATGLLLFRGALEGTYYFISTMVFLTLVVLGNEYVGTFMFLIGATCLYISFYRTRLIPRWLSV
jgi:hypothetical protein